ncbi:MAG: adenylyltransferase/cytidyltransferase family protein [Deltaproteobacteria bacterium]|nr:adenylyltransferase/cytidyltransferase family protein [Deltaproteobacteria bacterium]
MVNKIKNRDELAREIRELRGQGLKVVFTNGCFDLLHVGHVRYLTEAKAKGDILVVGLNSDRSVLEIKSPKRPIVPEDQRAEVLASLSCVDFITIFDEPDPLALIKTLLPDILVKGADWAEDEIIGKEVVEEVVRIPVIKGASTSGIIEKIVELYCNEA